MGRKEKLFDAVKKVFSRQSSKKDNQDEEKRTPRPKRKNLFGKQKPADLSSTTCGAEPENYGNGRRILVGPPPPTPVEEIRTNEGGNEQNKRAYDMALATTTAAEAAMIAAHKATEVGPVASSGGPEFAGNSREDAAAVKIQTAFRGYLAKRAVRVQKRLKRLKSLVDNASVKRQSANTLRCMQTMARMQSQIRNRRTRMTEENHNFHRQLQLKREKELEALKASMGENWDDSLQTKEKIEAKLLSRHEATVKRERALAYAYSHQWKNTSRSVNSTFTDPNNPSWGWSWPERWMASRPWESKDRITREKDANNNDHTSKTGESVKASYALPSPSTPRSFIRRKTKLTSPKGGGGHDLSEDDSRSLFSLQSERTRRHSLAGSSVRDDEESLGSSPSIPTYMTPTQSARAKSRMQSHALVGMKETPKSQSPGSVGKKNLSYTGAEKKGSIAMARRHSGPPKVSTSPVR